MEELSAAVRFGTYEEVRTAMLHHDVTTDTLNGTLPSMNGRTCLHVAALRLQGDMVRLLLAHGAEPDALDTDGKTPLHALPPLPNAEQVAELTDALAVTTVQQKSTDAGENSDGTSPAVADKADMSSPSVPDPNAKVASIAAERLSVVKEMLVAAGAKPLAPERISDLDRTEIAKQIERQRLAAARGSGNVSETSSESDIEDAIAESDDYVDKNFMRKVIVVFMIPFVYLIFAYGPVFALQFLLCTAAFYAVGIAYFIADLTIHPQWHRPTPGARKMTMRNLPDEWRGVARDPRKSLGMNFEPVEFQSSSGYILRGWWIAYDPAFAAREYRSRHPYDIPSAHVPHRRAASVMFDSGLDSRPPRSSSCTHPGAMSSEEALIGRRGRSDLCGDVSLGDLEPPSEASNMAIVFGHGGGRDRRSWLRHVPMFHRHGFSCLLFDFSEHGASDGWHRGLSFGIRERYDMIAAAEFVRREKGFKRVAVVGTSMGGSASIMAAAMAPDIIDVVVAENPLMTAARLQSAHLHRILGGYFHHKRYSKLALRVFDGLCTSWLNLRLRNKPSRQCQALHVVSRISPRPVLLLHGTHDQVVPFTDSQELFSRAREPKELGMLRMASHVQLYDKNPAWFERKVIGFLKRYERTSPADAHKAEEPKKTR